jgi:hypothetical protein
LCNSDFGAIEARVGRVGDAYKALRAQLENALVRRRGPVELQAHDVRVFQGDILNRKDCQRVGIRPEGVGKVLKNLILHEERLASSTRQIQAVPHGLRREVEDRRPLADELDHRLAIHQRRDAIQSIRRDRESVDGTAREVALIEEHSRLNPELMEEGFLD